MKSVWSYILGACCAAALLVCAAEAELVLHYDFSERGGRDNDTR